MTIRTLFSSLLMVATVAACIDPYDPKLVGGDRYLVFEGTLTDAVGPYRFTLSQSAGYNSSESVFDQRITGAGVSVTDGEGQATRFLDAGRGAYVSPPGFRGKTGRRYALMVTYNEQTYQSAPESMQPVPPIDSVYWQYQARQTATVRGQFIAYLNLTDPAATENYYQWDWVHYEQPAYCLLFRPDGPATYGKPCCTDCWNITRSSGASLLASDRLINGNRLLGQAIAEVPFDDITPYYLAIGQQSLSREAFQYWQTVRALTSNVGGVFDATPATLRGNIRNLNADGPPMLGFFQVSARRQTIVYVSRFGAPVQPFAKTVYPTWPKCEPCAESLFRTATMPEGWR